MLERISSVSDCLQVSKCAQFSTISKCFPFRFFFNREGSTFVTNGPLTRKQNTTIGVSDGPNLNHFVANKKIRNQKIIPSQAETLHYLSSVDYAGNGSKVHFITYGCQMNVNDVEIVRAIMLSSGYVETNFLKEADVVMIMTCSIRESAELKIWDKLKFIKATNKRSTVCVLGCMAERLKNALFSENQLVQVVSGPDSYRDLPRLLAVVRHGAKAMNVQLSLEETYADIVPVRTAVASKTAFVSIMRGCDNMCTYCIVPFTRGRERSRPMKSILEEIRQLSDEGFKQITLLGQNVNSYRDYSELSHSSISADEPSLSLGFRTISKPKTGGKTFITLLEEVSKINPELRIRFTSPHPKDFPLQLIELIAERNNLCKQIHLPAQSGSNAVLDRMGRGYTVDAYLKLVENIRKILPGVNISSDFIAGFCGESEDDHKASVDLIKHVGYSFCYVYPYSMREKTHASRKLTDDVTDEVKHRRHLELAAAFRREAARCNEKLIGSVQLVLIEGRSKRSPDKMTGKVDGGITAIVEGNEFASVNESVSLNAGDYVALEIFSATSQTVRGRFLEKTTLSKFFERYRCP